MISRAWLGTAAAAVCVLAGSALAQITAVTPYYAAVTADEGVLRCGSSDAIGLLNSMYQVAKLQKGQLLKVDGEAQGWVRVSYPAGSYLFVPSDCAQVDTTAKTVSVTKPTMLKAPNMTLGYKGSWKDVLDKPLAAGAKLNLVEAEAAVDGRGNTAFKVAPPDGARAFIPSTAIRKATQDEINAFNATAAKPVEQGKQPAQATGPQSPPTNLTQPQVVPAPNATPTNPPATTAQNPAAPAGPETTAQTPTPPKPPAPKPSPYEKLEAALEAIKAQPADRAEYSELLAQYQAEHDKIKADDSSARMLKARLMQRIKYLKALADIQTQQREFHASSAEFAADEKKLQERMAEVAQARQYTIVGRLSASAIYDGKRLPLMYRVQAVGGPATRTIAYVKPDEELKIDSKLGQIVGVIGEAKVDPTLKLNIITPTRIDTLEAAPASEATPGAAAPAPKDAEPKADPKEEPKAEPKKDNNK